MIYWRLEPHMRAKGWSTAYRLAAEAGISRPGALRVLSGAPVERIDASVLVSLAQAFGVKNPLTLLEYRDE